MNSNMLSMLNQLRQNPMSMLGKFNISQNVNLSDPNNIIQHLMNTGQISQQAYNNARSMAMNLQNKM
jgi:predicted FMN-binding regulatory protein PaiB